MSIQHFAVQFNPASPLVGPDGVPLRGYGRAYFLGVYNRGGAANGVIPSVSPPLTATGTTINNALQLANDWNDIEAPGAALAGVIISAALALQPGNDIWVFNGTIGTKNVFPPNVNAQIDALGNGNPYQLGSGKLRCFQCWSLTQFRSYGN